MSKYEFSVERDKIIFHNAFNSLYNWNGSGLGNLNKIPHELIFIKCLKYEVLENPNTALEFLIFCDKYYLEYPIVYNLFDPVSSVLLELNKMEYLINKNKYLDEKDKNDIQTLYQFGEIATDFLIRVKGYSLIDCSSQKIIVTAKNNCEKIFEEYLTNGYSLQRKQKYVFKMDKYISSAHFSQMPVMPTKDSYYEIDEIIEVAPNKYQKTLNWHFK